VPKALITGITGQDGSFLAEQLLDKGYEVHGIVRRSSSFNTERLDPIYRDRHEEGVKLFLHHGDLQDSSRLVRLLYELQPDEVYNLAAQSHVRVSYDVPEYTNDVTGMGTVRMLEAMRDAGVKARFYQASSSDMFGSTPPPQDESTPFHPRSPYAVAKVQAFWITVNYRESYGMHASNGILFNHECIAATTPLMVRERGIAAVKTPGDLVPLLRTGASVQQFEPRGLLEVWDGTQWTPVSGVTATRRRRTDPDHRLLSIQGRAGTVDVTAHHHMLDADFEQVRARDLQEGGRLALAEEMPPAEEWSAVTPQLAELLGYLAGDGYVSRDGANVRFTNSNGVDRFLVEQLWSQCFLGGATEGESRSGFDNGEPVHYVALVGAPAIGPWLRSQLYTPTAHKQVPPVVLNADEDARRAFLRGYYAADGLKAGKGRSIKTNSAVLAQGLCWLFHLVDEPASVYIEHRDGVPYYQLNLASAVRVGAKGQHLRKDPAEVRRIADAQVADDEWVFDIATESGVFCAGVGRVVVHNSERRGETFVTRKVTRGLAAIHLGLQDKLFMGNLDAQRDWGYAPDYTDAMWRMLQRDEPDDYVIATGEMHSVREFLDEAAAHLGMDWEKHVEFDPRYLRPAEVDALQGDPTKAREKLGWTPQTTFKDLVRIMISADVKTLEDQLAGRGVRAGERHG
jgi:GDPmannose 4,6-dehydratase